MMMMMKLLLFLLMMMLLIWTTNSTMNLQHLRLNPTLDREDSFGSWLPVNYHIVMSQFLFRIPFHFEQTKTSKKTYDIIIKLPINVNFKPQFLSVCYLQCLVVLKTKKMMLTTENVEKVMEEMIEKVMFVARVKVEGSVHYLHFDCCYCCL
jgi:hypothetical protein